jgi:hypothetical protein
MKFFAFLFTLIILVSSAPSGNLTRRPDQTPSDRNRSHSRV